MPIIRNTTTALLFLIISLILVAGINWYAIENVSSLMNKEKWVSHTREVMQKTEKAEKLTARMNTGYTGYLLTNNKKYLTPFTENIPALKTAIDNLKTVTSDNPQQQKNIEKLSKLVKKLTAYANNLINIYDEKGIQNAKVLINSNIEKNILKDIQQQFFIIEQEENRLLADRVEIVRQKAHLVYWIQIIGTLLIFILLLLAYRLMKRELIRRIKAQKETINTAEELDRYFSLTPGLSLISDFNGKVHKLNYRWQKELGYSKKELNTIRFYKLVHQEDRQKAIEAVKSLFIGKNVNDLQVRMLNKKGEAKWWAWAAAADSKRKLIYTTAHNIHELKTTKENLSMLTERFQLATRIGKIGVWDWNLKTNELIVDSILKDIYGFGSEEKNLTLFWTERLHPEDRKYMQQKIRESISKRTEFNETFRIIHPVKGIKYIQTIGKVFYDENGKPQRMLGVNWDITGKIKTERELKKAKEKAEEATRAKSLFLANMSHEIRTPMNAVLGYIEVLSRKITDPVQKEYLASMQSSSNALLNLINDLLDFSKAESGKLTLNNQSTDIRYIIHDIESIFRLKAQQKNLEFVVEIDKNIPDSMLLDELKVRQILLNLTSNAIKFTNKGYVKIKVSSQNIDSKKADLILEVKDTGKGIPEEHHKKIFQLFEQEDKGITRKYGGTGLGLAITMQIVKLMHGRVLLDSKEGSGSTFRIILPNISITDKMDAPEKLKGFHLDNLIFNPATILIVDDTPSNIEVLKAMLEPQPFIFLEAANGRIALEILKHNKVDFVFMDIRMPEMDGITAIHEIRNHEDWSHIPIVALSASSTDFDSSQLKKHGFNDYVRKPATESEIAGVLVKYLKYEVKNQVKNNGQQELSKETIRNFDNIISEIQKEIIPLQKNLLGLRPRAEVKNMAIAIIDIGKKFKSDEILFYGEKLLTANENFLFEKEKELIEKFPDFINNLQSLYNEHKRKQK